MTELIVRYGVIAVFVGAIFEGDVTLMLTGVAAHLGISTSSSVLAPVRPAGC